MKKQAGFTLIEILIASLLGLIIISATISVYASTIKGSTNTINSARLNHDLESVMALMVNDIRRAGYWGDAIVGANSANNSFTALNPDNTVTSDIQIPTANCILYSYDADGDGVLDSGEYYGFQFMPDADSGNGVIKILSGAAADCSSAEWNTLTAEYDVNITAATFTMTYKCLDASAVPVPPAVSVSFNSTCALAVPAGTLPSHKLVESREVTIALTGQLVNDTTVTKTLTGTVKVRNDRICIQGTNC